MSNPCFFFFFFLIASFCISSFASGDTLPQDEVKVLEDIAKRLGKKDWDFSDPSRNWTSEVGCNCDYNSGTVCHVTNITLKEQNLQGTLPPDLYKLPYLREIDLSRNYLNGTIPAEWGSTKLDTIRIRGNQFSGKIPDFIQNLTNLTVLHIEGNGFSGPIPSGISNLENLTDLRISDLRGSEPSPFPLLGKMKNLQKLILRNCNIIGDLPKYLGDMTSLDDNLDLSFNKLTGQIPDTYAALLRKVTYIYLTGNLLNGSVPSWIENAKSIDISYNNLSITSQGSATCSHENRNLFGNCITNGSGADACLGDHTCSKMMDDSCGLI